MSRFNDRLLLAVVAIIALSPLPIGSNRPFFWSLNGILIGIIALLSVLGENGSRRRSRLPLRSFAVPGVLVGLTVAWMIVQLLPLPAALGSDAWASASAALGIPLASRISVDPAATIGMIIRYLSYALLFFVAAQITLNPNRAQRFVKVLFWVTVAHAAYAILALLALGDTLLLLPKWAYQGYATGAFVNRNHFATFLGFGMVVGTALFLDSLGYGTASPRRSTQNRFWRSLSQGGGSYGTGLVILATGILLSGSRMGAAATAAGMLTVFVFTLFRSPGQRLGLAAWLVPAIVAGGGILMFSGGRLLDRLGSVESNADERLLLYRQVGEMIKARPLTGYGGGTFNDAFQAFHQLPLSADVTWTAAHNLYLELFSDLGIFGLLPILLAAWLFILFLRAGIRATRPLVFSAGAGVLVLAGIHSLVDFSLQIEANVFQFIAVLAVGFAQAHARTVAQPEPARGFSATPAPTAQPLTPAAA